MTAMTESLENNRSSSSSTSSNLVENPFRIHWEADGSRTSREGTGTASTGVSVNNEEKSAQIFDDEISVQKKVFSQILNNKYHSSCYYSPNQDNVS